MQDCDIISNLNQSKMKTILKLLGLLLFLALTSCNSPVDNELTSQDKQAISSLLIEITQDWVSAMQNDDFEQLDQILSEDHVYHRDNGEVWDKARVLKHYIEDVPDFDSTGVFDMTVHVYSSDLAMVMGKAKFIFKDEMGVVIDVTNVWSNLYRKENNQWRCLFGMGCGINNN